MGVAGVMIAAVLSGCAGTPDGDTSSSPIGGTAVCDEATLTEVVRSDVDQTYPGASFVSLEEFTCDDGWASARALVDTSGAVIPTAFYLRAEGQFWVPVSIEDICSVPLAQSEVPQGIYIQACGPQD